MARRWVNLLGVTPLLLGMMVSVPQIVVTPLVLAQSSQTSQSSNPLTEAQRLYEEGENLREQGTRESLQQALAKFQQALPLFRANSDSPEERLRQRYQEATTLNNIGNIYYRIGQPEQSVTYYQQALLIRREVGNSTEERLRQRSGELQILNNVGLSIEI